MAKIKMLLAVALAISAATVASGSAQAHDYRFVRVVPSHAYAPPSWGYAELRVPYVYSDREHRRAEKRAEREFRRHLKREAKAYKKLGRAYARHEFRYGYPYALAPAVVPYF